jgi:hypothetical protein
VNVAKDNTGIVVTFPYNPLLVEKIKTITSDRWDSEKKFWSFPKRHTHSKTAEIYAQISTKGVGKIKSPLGKLEFERKGVIGV